MSELLTGAVSPEFMAQEEEFLLETSKTRRHKSVRTYIPIQSVASSPGYRMLLTHLPPAAKAPRKQQMMAQLKHEDL